MSLWNISSAVTTVFVVGWMPMISTSSFLLSLPRSTASGGHGAATFDREHVLDRHQEGLVDRPLRLGNVGVDRIHQLHDLGRPLGVAFERLERRDAHDRDVVTRVLVLAEQLAEVELHQLDELFVVDHVALVERDDERRHVDLAREDDVLAGLRHGAVVRGHDKDRAVHLGGAGDHVLDVVLVTRAVHVRVVALLRLVLDVGDRNRDTAGLLFRRLVDLVEGRVLGQSLLRQHLRDRSRQRRLAVVDVTDRPDVEVRLGPHELLLRHCFLLTNSDYVRDVVRRPTASARFPGISA